MASAASPSPSSPNPNPNSNSTPTNPSSSSAAADPATPTLALPPPPAVPLHPPPPSSSSRRVPPPCWSLEETLALIDSYHEKWHSLRRGNLRASHWQDVADAVARRCQRLPASASTPKTAVQCRHKMEKLRKRYRSERQRSLRANPNSPPSSSWVFFRKMDAMELGPSSSTPPARIAHGSGAPSSSRSSSSDAASPSDDGDDDDDDGGASNNFSSRGFHGVVPNGAAQVGSGLRFKIPKAVRTKMGVPRSEEHLSSVYPSSGHGSRFFRGYPGPKPPSGMEDMRRMLEKKRMRESEGGGGVAEVVAAVRMLGDGFMRMEQMKMDMASEIHKLRMDMELKRTEMVLDTQRQIVDAFVKEFVGKKRAKIAPES